MLRIHILIPHAGVPGDTWRHRSRNSYFFSINLGFTPGGQLNCDLLIRLLPKVTQIHHNDGAQVRL